MREKLSFAMANFGNIPVMTLINGYLLIFYTNICGLSPAACATLFLIARFLDAINDPLVGFMIDHLPTRKMGHFRPTLILGTILCSANFLLLWFGPMLSTSGKLAIAYVSYILLGVLFPVMDISLNSLLPVMTEDMKERNSLSSIKGLAYVIGALVIGVAAPLILGDTSNKPGYINLVLIMTAVIFFFSIIGTMGVKERVKPQMENSYSVKELFKILSQKPVYITFLAVLLYSIGSNIVNAANTYFYTYIFEDLTLASIITLITCVTVFPATMVIGNLLGRFGKKKMYAIGLALAGLVCDGKWSAFYHRSAEKILREGDVVMSKKPKCPLIGQDGNIFNLMGIASKTLKRNGMYDEAKEMCSRITSSGSYYEALNVIGEYVEITSTDDEQTEDEDMEMEMM